MPSVPNATAGATTVMPLSRFLTRLIWLSVLPLLMLAAWMAVNSVRATHAKQDEEATHLVRNFATAIDQQLNANLGALNMLALAPSIDDPARWEQLYKLYNEAQSYRKTFGSHVVFALVGDPMYMLFNTRETFGSILPPCRARREILQRK